ncbi:sugar phosphate isomerase/epimerase [Planotetraspora sp. A-T 1434]|uniref:sugar phosphate isomerase/epimerase family protein n=1 Tax=Planotetraspora sp. A-T 1434 TaxID=2979219 RepID=UPI0021C12165|nr:sugar phosphate isomerase/epimerase [Planotetraspora sp. A-T 1434]MCT9929678.1 sugar phosphate isomerase/epimerase [Planotetraspora sp. A-T 1434]
MTRVASAPVNFGIYSRNTDLIGPGELLAGMAEAGYDGVDSGPIGFLPSDDLARAGLGLAGGWVDLRYGDADGFEADLAGLRAALEAFTSVPVDDPRFAPRPTLACPSNIARFAKPGGLAPGIPDEAWPEFAARVQIAANVCRQAGLEPAFHYHLGTDVETAADVEKLLELTDVGICLDTGHLWLAGGDPVAALRAWSDRVTQVHIKDASRTVLAQGGDLTTAVANGCFPALGQGEVDIAGFADALREVGYEGWIVIEQDHPATGQDLGAILADQRANREFLKGVGL